MKKRILTGLQATSSQLHIGNYFSAVKPMITLLADDSYESFLFVAIMHSFTQLHDAFKIKEYSHNLIKIYLACGVDFDKTLVYNPAHIPGHAQLCRVFNCITNMGFMQRMHVYKDAKNKGIENEISVGTFCYPILMAADILLYDADLVPVGKDQKQHVEFARDMAIKFNSQYGDTFKLPEPYIQEGVAVIPGIDGRKMSKSYDNYIGLLDEADILLKKVKTIPTEAIGINDPKDPDKCNIYNILKLFLDENENEEIRNKYTQGGLGFKYVKDVLYEKLVNFLKPIQTNYANISDSQVTEILDKNIDYVKDIANKKIQEVYKKVGFDL